MHTLFNPVLNQWVFAVATIALIVLAVPAFIFRNKITGSGCVLAIGVMLATSANLAVHALLAGTLNISTSNVSSIATAATPILFGAAIGVVLASLAIRAMTVPR